MLQISIVSLCNGYDFTFEISFCLVFSTENLFQYSGCFFIVASLLVLPCEGTVFKTLLFYL